MSAPLFTVAGLAARPLSAEEAAATRELFASCDGSEDLTCGLPVGTADDPLVADSGADADLLIGMFDGWDTAGVIEIVRDAPSAGWWTIGLLMVETGRRGAALGREVLDALSEWATTRGVTGLLVGVPMGPAEAFWRAAGFTEATGAATTPSSTGGLVELRRVLGTGDRG